MKKIKYWLILEKSEETRISHSFDSYDDTTGEIYNYDNSVPNYRNVNRGDLIIIRKENQIVGSGTIEKIDKSPSEKERRRCPSCDKTDIRKRVSKIPQWKCGSCSYEFDNPTSTIDPIIAYSATISSYSKINNPPDYKEVKDCSVLDNGRSNQNSIIELDKNKVELLFSDFSFEVNKK